MNELTTREIALVFWTAAFGLWAMLQPKVRTSILGLLRHAVFSKLAWVWISLFAYAAALVVALRLGGVWHQGLMKATVVWFFFSAVAYPVQFGDSGRTQRVWRTVVKDGLSAFILVEVLVNTYTFALPLELVLVPALAVLALVGAFAEMKPEYRQVAGAVGAVQVVIGLWLAAMALRAAIADQASELLVGLQEAMLPIVLTFGMVPYILVLRFVLEYEGMLWRIGWRSRVSKGFQFYAAARIMLHLKLRPSRVKAFLQRNGLRLHEVTTVASLDQMLAEDRQQRALHVVEP